MSRKSYADNSDTRFKNLWYNLDNVWIITCDQGMQEVQVIKNTIYKTFFYQLM